MKTAEEWSKLLDPKMGIEERERDIERVHAIQLDALQLRTENESLLIAHDKLVRENESLRGQVEEIKISTIESAARVIHERVDECINGLHDSKSSEIKRTHQIELAMAMCCEADILTLAETVKKEGK